MQLSTYDAVKSWLQRRVGLTDGLPLVTAASFVTGAAVVGAMQPFDYAATRLVDSKSAAELVRTTKLEAGAGSGGGGGGAAAYTSPFDVIQQTLRAEGVRGLYRGGMANYARFAPYCILVFIFVEQGRKAASWRRQETTRGR